MIKVIRLNSEKDTAELAKKIAAQVNIGDVIALSGDLGTGKTFFTQELCKALEVDEYVSSPSFIILNEYSGKLDIAHYDLYRLGSPEEVLEIGLIDLMEIKLTIIEWYEIARDFLPDNTIYLDISFIDNVRQVQIHTGMNLVI